jgi:hypothetical protein
MYETLDQVIAVTPEGGWRQDVWITHNETCGTAGCFAGWRVMLDGYTELRFNGENEVTALCNPDTGECVLPTQIADWATRSLGLNSQEVNRLFCSDNTLRDLKEIVDELCERG